MKFKALRTKREPKEFVEIQNIGGINMVFTSDTPNLMSVTATIDLLKQYYEQHSPLSKEINLDDYEFVEYDLIETDIIGADIRNKLSSPKNLIELLTLYFGETEKERKEKLEDFIKKEMKESFFSINYLADLL